MLQGHSVANVNWKNKEHFMYIEKGIVMGTGVQVAKETFVWHKSDYTGWYIRERCFVPLEDIQCTQ